LNATGTVSDFDDASGLGTITADDGTVYVFHCTAIADGSRTITGGTEVEFETRPARHGNYEAAVIQPRAAGRTPSAAG
jgi:cold shock CspA family protein